MKVKLTPLNIVSAIGLVAAVMLFIGKNDASGPGHVDISGLLIGLCVLMSVVAFVSDLIFRKFIAELRKLWVIEGAFIIFTLVLMFILKVSIG